MRVVRAALPQYLWNRLLSPVLRRLWCIGWRLRGKLEDRRLGIETLGEHVLFDHSRVPAEVRAQCPDAHRYAPAGYGALGAVLGYISPEDVFVDVGCGKGRAVCFVASGMKLRKVIGVEIESALVDAARRNVSCMRLRTPVELIRGDVRTADIGEGTVYFLYNPFGEETLQAMLDSIRRSLADNPRHVRIIYLQPLCAHVLDSADWLVRESRANNGPFPIIVWRSKSAAEHDPPGG